MTKAAAQVTMPDASADERALRARRKVRRQLVMLVVIGLAPVIASYAVYYGFRRGPQVNYGTLYATPAPLVAGRFMADDRPFALADLRGQWVMLTAAPGACPPGCVTKLYATRQARTIQNAERDRLVRVWLVTDGAAPAADLLAAHPDLQVVSGATTSALPAGGREIYLVDPLGNLVMSWPADPDVKAVSRDLGRLLRASRIG